jgi:hypothetical protein
MWCIKKIKKIWQFETRFNFELKYFEPKIFYFESKFLNPTKPHKLQVFKTTHIALFSKFQFSCHTVFSTQNNSISLQGVRKDTKIEITTILINSDESNLASLSRNWSAKWVNLVFFCLEKKTRFFSLQIAYKKTHK